MADAEPMGGGVFEKLAPAEAGARMKAGARLIDVREQGEYDAAHIAGAELAPLSGFDPARFSADDDLVFLCRSGARTRRLAEGLTAMGWRRVAHLEGGVLAWHGAGLPLRKTDPRTGESVPF